MIMGIRKISAGFAAVALLGSMPAMAAAPIMPTVAKISLAPSSMIGARLGAPASRGSSSIAAGGALIAVLAAAAVVGGTVAATSGGHSSVSP
jgi:hypothetical protein